MISQDVKLAWINVPQELSRSGVGLADICSLDHLIGTNARQHLGEEPSASKWSE